MNVLESPLIPAMLRAAAIDEPIDRRTTISEGAQRWLTAAGLAPLLCHLLRQSGWDETSIPEAIKGAELTAKVKFAVRARGLRRVDEILKASAIEAIPIKGVSIASHYYPAPHLRVMRDTDLLVGADDRANSVDSLLENGYERYVGKTDKDYSDHHHAVPLFSEDDRIWVELHSALLPFDSRISNSEPTRFRHLKEVLIPDKGSMYDWRVKPEVELAVLATGWCIDLGADFGQSGLQRALFDGIYLLRGAEGLDCGRLLESLRGTWAGDCLTVLLGYVNRYGAVPKDCDWFKAHWSSLSPSGATSLKLVFNLLDTRLIVARQGRETILSNANVASAIHALLSPGPDWKRIPRAVFRVATASGSPRSHSQFERLRSGANRIRDRHKALRRR